MLELIAALVSAGVTVATVDSAECGAIRGTYETESRTITLCTGSDKLPGDAETLRHEAIHAVQHCRAGLDNLTAMAGMETYYALAKEANLDLDDALTPYYMSGLEDEVINLEAEAIVLAQRWDNTKTVAVVRAACQSPFAF